ncbi:MAG: HNH endonuclease [Chloroflexi bacterium]|nr:HNH endonuclease [Chloroflexota bacterium]
MPTEHAPAAIRQVVAARAREVCEYCRTPAQFATQSFTLDHILPRDAGGTTTLENLAWACFGCNAHKHTQTHALDSQTNERVALFNPRQQTWREHFTWNTDLTRVLGKTACGRATVEALRLNRPGLVNLRRLLVAAKFHPPAEE